MIWPTNDHLSRSVSAHYPGRCRHLRLPRYGNSAWRGLEADAGWKQYPTLREDIQGEIDYFTANKQRMDYRRYRELGLPIGSGTVESACKNVVAARMKQSGMMWSLPGATGMLQLRASIKSRRFNIDHERLLPESSPQETERMAA